MQILLVDDDLPSREALSELLQLAGHRVVSAENGKVALERLRKNDGYCVILLDVMMPVMDGFEFRHRQLQDERLASIPVIVVTADGRARREGPTTSHRQVPAKADLAGRAAEGRQGVLPGGGRGLLNRQPRLVQAARTLASTSGESFVLPRLELGSSASKDQR